MNREFLSLAVFLSLMLSPYVSDFSDIKDDIAGKQGIPTARIGGATR